MDFVVGTRDVNVVPEIVVKLQKPRAKTPTLPPLSWRRVISRRCTPGTVPVAAPRLIGVGFGLKTASVTSTDQPPDVGGYLISG
jgi:hypothetical protein